MELQTAVVIRSLYKQFVDDRSDLCTTSGDHFEQNLRWFHDYLQRNCFHFFSITCIKFRASCSQLLLLFFEFLYHIYAAFVINTLFVLAICCLLFSRRLIFTSVCPLLNILCKQFFLSFQKLMLKFRKISRNLQFLYNF